MIATWGQGEGVGGGSVMHGHAQYVSDDTGAHLTYISRELALGAWSGAWVSERAVGAGWEVGGNDAEAGRVAQEARPRDARISSDIDDCILSCMKMNHRMFVRSLVVHCVSSASDDCGVVE